MTSPFGESPPSAPVHDPTLLIGSLGLEELRSVGDKLTSSPDPLNWRETVRGVRREIEDGLSELGRKWLQYPLPEAPTYDSANGPLPYLDIVRQANLDTPMHTGQDLKSFRERNFGDMTAYLRLTESFVERNAAQIPGYSEATAKHMKDSFASNVRWLIAPPRIAADKRHHSYRLQALRELLPDVTFITPDLIRRTSREQNVTLYQVEHARQTMDALPSTMPVPDFFQMDRAQRIEIVEALGQQWLELNRILYATEPRLITRQQYGRCRPLSLRDVSVLKNALDELPDPAMTPRICRAFLDQPREFEQLLTTFRGEYDYRQELPRGHAADPRQPLTETLEARAEKNDMPENMVAITNLLEHESVKSEVLDLVPGMEVALTELDDPITIKEFDELVDLHLQLLGRALNEAHPVRNPRGVTMPNWERRGIGALLRSDFQGTLRNLKIARLPVTEEDLQETFPDTYDPTRIQPGSVAHLLMTVEQKSSGRPPSVAAVDFLLVSRKHTDRADTIHRTGAKVLKATGSALAHSVRDESRAVARVVEAYRLSQSFRAGLPGFRKHY